MLRPLGDSASPCAGLRAFSQPHPSRRLSLLTGRESLRGDAARPQQQRERGANTSRLAVLATMPALVRVCTPGAPSTSSSLLSNKLEGIAVQIVPQERCRLCTYCFCADTPPLLPAESSWQARRSMHMHMVATDQKGSSSYAEQYQSESR
eukprot:1897000-Rhodomonas_salina.2